MLLVRRIIIPVDKLQTLRNLHVVRHGLVFDIIFTAKRKAEKHVAPHLRLKAVFSANLHDTFQMLLNDFHTVLIAVRVQIFAKSDHVGLIHSKIHTAGRKCIGHRLQVMIEERIRPLIPGKKNIVSINEFLIMLIPGNLIEVRQRLDVRTNLYAEELCIADKLRNLFLRIGSAHVAKIRLLRDREGILQIQPDEMISHQSRLSDQFFQRIYSGHGISGAVRHIADFGKPTLALPLRHSTARHSTARRCTARRCKKCPAQIRLRSVNDMKLSVRFRIAIAGQRSLLSSQRIGFRIRSALQSRSNFLNQFRGNALDIPCFHSNLAEAKSAKAVLPNAAAGAVSTAVIFS